MRGRTGPGMRAEFVFELVVVISAESADYFAAGSVFAAAHQFWAVRLSEPLFLAAVGYNHEACFQVAVLLSQKFIVTASCPPKLYPVSS